MPIFRHTHGITIVSRCITSINRCPQVDPPEAPMGGIGMPETAHGRHEEELMWDQF